MKKLLIICGLLMSVGLFAQVTPERFALQADGIMLANDKSYIVVEFPGKTKSELYSDILVSSSAMYVSPKDVLSVVENESITINGYAKECLHYGMNIISVNYSITILFKDGKIRINSPQVVSIRFDSGKITTNFTGWLNTQNFFVQGVVNSKPNKKKVIDEYNDKMNSLIYNILNYKAVEEDW